MPDHEAKDLTLLLRRWSEGSDEALEQLAFRVAGELRRLARHYLRSEQKGHLLESGALVNEAWLRLIGWRNDVWQNREHFFGMAAQMMRRVLVDEARKRNYAKRGGDNFRVSLSEVDQPVIWRAEELIALDEALETLSYDNARGVLKRAGDMARTLVAMGSGRSQPTTAPLVES